MEDELIHELSAAYALDALDADDERLFEAHLAQCPDCQEDVARFSATASALAFAAPPATPPDSLRDRLLTAARAERTNVTPLRRGDGHHQRALALVAAVTTAAAIALGVWVAVPHRQGPQRLDAVPLTGAKGSLVLGKHGEATLVVAGLTPAPSGKTYEAWVIEHRRAVPAGLFSIRGGTGVVQLTQRVPAGATVAVTLEQASGALAPSGPPLVSAQT